MYYVIVIAFSHHAFVVMCFIHIINKYQLILTLAFEYNLSFRQLMINFKTSAGGHSSQRQHPYYLIKLVVL